VLCSAFAQKIPLIKAYLHRRYFYIGGCQFVYTTTHFMGGGGGFPRGNSANGRDINSLFRRQSIKKTSDQKSKYLIEIRHFQCLLVGFGHATCCALRAPFYLGSFALWRCASHPSHSNFAAWLFSSSAKATRESKFYPSAGIKPGLPTMLS
jgi:hypothetical protein